MKAYLEDARLNYLPVVEAFIESPVNGRGLRVKLVVDTGFQGGVLIPLRTYLDLKLNLHEEPKAVGRAAVGGEVELRVSRVIVRVGNVSVRCRAYTALGVRKSLLGREALKELGMLYKPPRVLKVGLSNGRV